jgi:hypothetical protein
MSPRFGRRVAAPPFRPASRASSGVNSCAVPARCAASPPMRATSVRRSGLKAAKPRGRRTGLAHRAGSTSSDVEDGGSSWATNVLVSGQRLAGGHVMAFSGGRRPRRRSKPMWSARLARPLPEHDIDESRRRAARAFATGGYDRPALSFTRVMKQQHARKERALESSCAPRSSFSGAPHQRGVSPPGAA